MKALAGQVRPALVIDRLGHEPRAGYIALRGFLPAGVPGAGPIARFANVVVRPDHVPFNFAAPRPVVDRDGVLIMVDDDRMRLDPGEVPMTKWVRFRTLGCYPLSGAIESRADTLTGIIQEMLLATTSERQGRIIDHDGAASMEKKKQEGYF